MEQEFMQLSTLRQLKNWSLFHPHVLPRLQCPLHLHSLYPPPLPLRASIRRRRPVQQTPPPLHLPPRAMLHLQHHRFLLPPPPLHPPPRPKIHRLPHQGHPPLLRTPLQILRPTPRRHWHLLQPHHPLLLWFPQLLRNPTLLPTTPHFLRLVVPRSLLAEPQMAWKIALQVRPPPPPAFLPVVVVHCRALLAE